MFPNIYQLAVSPNILQLALIPNICHRAMYRNTCQHSYQTERDNIHIKLNPQTRICSFSDDACFRSTMGRSSCCPQRANALKPSALSGSGTTPSETRGLGSSSWEARLSAVDSRPTPAPSTSQRHPC